MASCNIVPLFLLQKCSFLLPSIFDVASHPSSSHGCQNGLLIIPFLAAKMTIPSSSSPFLATKMWLLIISHFWIPKCGFTSFLFSCCQNDTSFLHPRVWLPNRLLIIPIFDCQIVASYPYFGYQMSFLSSPHFWLPKCGFLSCQFFYAKRRLLIPKCGFLSFIVKLPKCASYHPHFWIPKCGI